MANENTTLGELVNEYEREEQKLQAQLSAVQQRKKMVLELLNGSGQRVLFAARNDVVHAAASGKPTGLTKAVLNALQRLARDRAVLASEVTDELRSQNFQPQSENFSTSVYLALMRLANQEKARTVTHDGRRMFMMRNGHEN